MVCFADDTVESFDTDGCCRATELAGYSPLGDHLLCLRCGKVWKPLGDGRFALLGQHVGSKKDWKRLVELARESGWPRS